MGWKNWFSRKQGKSDTPLECTPSLLAHMFLAAVASDGEGIRTALKLVARTIEIPDATEAELEQWLQRWLGADKEIALFKQLCLFHDALWYKILLPDRILKTGRVSHDSIRAYAETVRQKSMELIAQSEHLPRECTDWGTGADLQTDFKFYMEGVVPSDRQERFDRVLNFTQARGKGPVFEMLAWLFMRTMEILGLFDKKDFFIHMTMWKSQTNYTCGLIEKVMNQVVPIPE